MVAALPRETLWIQVGEPAGQALALDPSRPCVVVSTDQSDPELLTWMRELGAHEVTGKPLDLVLLMGRHARPAAGAA
jgi:hypothetical protein